MHAISGGTGDDLCADPGDLIVDGVEPGDASFVAEVFRRWPRVQGSYRYYKAQPVNRGNEPTTPLLCDGYCRLGLDQEPVSYTHLRAHETDSYLVCRLLLEKK